MGGDGGGGGKGGSIPTTPEVRSGSKLTTRRSSAKDSQRGCCQTCQRLAATIYDILVPADWHSNAVSLEGRAGICPTLHTTEMPKAARVLDERGLCARESIS